jgi:hypothetical protein
MKIVLLGIVLILVMSTVGAYAGVASATSDQTVDSPNTGPMTIGWRLEDGKVDGVTVTWTPAAAALYTIEATTAGITGTVTTLVTGTGERTDVVPITAVDPLYIETVNVIIVES